MKALPFLLALGAVIAQENSAPQEGSALVVLGVVGPQNVALTASHSRASKPVVVIVQNRSARPEIIPDAAALENLVALQIAPLGGVTTLQPVLVPPPKFPITLQPAQKFSIVFQVTFDRAGSSADVNGFRYAATVNPAALTPATAANAGSDTLTAALLSPNAGTSAVGTFGMDRIVRGVSVNPFDSHPDMGATVTASKTHVALKKGQNLSDPITFTSHWSESHFVSGWDETPSDTEGDQGIMTASQHSSPTARVQWKNAGTYTVGVYLEHPGVEAHPTIDVAVVGVEFKDDDNKDPDGMKVGVSTKTDRSRHITATVTPGDQSNSVTVKISKGSSILGMKNYNNDGNGTITFDIEGIGENGSTSPNDCQIEAQVEGKPAAQANVTVVIPKKVLSQSQGARQDTNHQINGGTSPSAQGVLPIFGIPATLHGWVVTVNVGDQFGDPITDANNPHLYEGAPVSELFITESSSIPINQKISAASNYADPTGITRWKNSPASPVPGIFNPFFNPGSTPLFPLPNVAAPQTSNTYFLVQVDDFTLTPAIKRTVTLAPGGVMTLTETPPN